MEEKDREVTGQENGEEMQVIRIRYKAWDEEWWHKEPVDRQIVLEATGEEVKDIQKALAQWKEVNGDWEGISRRSERTLTELYTVLDGIEKIRGKSICGLKYFSVEVVEEPRVFLLASDVEELINGNRRDKEQDPDDPDTPGYVKACEDMICFLGDLPTWDGMEVLDG